LTPTIRAPRPHELERLREIERAAGVVFVDVGLPEIAAHEPESIESLAEYARDGRAWVITEHEIPVGYAVVDIVDGFAHLEQLSVHPDRGRRGLGALLVEHVCEWARRQRLAAVTLTTFSSVAWNAPFYAKHGFRAMQDTEIGPELRELQAIEAAHGLDPTMRVCMRRDTDA